MAVDVNQSETSAAEAATADAVASFAPAAGRARAAGTFLAVARPDGSLAFHDGSAGEFFNRFVLPQIAALSARIGSVHPQTPAEVWDDVPGVFVAVCPVVDRRQLEAVLLLASARHESLADGGDEDVRRACGRLALDAAWITAQGLLLPAYTRAGIGAQAQLHVQGLRDQARVAGLERELDTLSGQLAETYEELSLIYQISSGMKVNRQAADFFKQTCEDVMQVMGLRGIGVSLDADGCAATADDRSAVVFGQVALSEADVTRLGRDVLAAVGERKGPILVNDVKTHPTLAWLAPHASRLLAVPLARQEQVLGCLFALDKLPDEDGDASTAEFDSVDSKLLNSIANECAIYLENATLFDDVHGLMMGILHSLTSAVDAKDPYTCGHSERVALLSRELARKAGLPDDEVERVYMAGLLHDVGKIGVPEAVLQKPGRLDEAEFAVIKKHPEIGARILGDIKQLRDVLPGVLHHHERYDGKGYPANLAGQDIPLLGRIICLADSFDAMTSSRTYRKAMPIEVALTEVRRGAGTQFDPQLAEAFLSIAPAEFESILREHRERSRKLIELQQTSRRAVA